MSREIAHGVDIHYRDRVSYIYLPDGSEKEYPLGSIIMELVSEKASYTIIDKMLNMIKCYPGYQQPVTIESITDGFRWLDGTIRDEEFSLITELAISNFNEKLFTIVGTNCLLYSSIGEFFQACYDEYIKDIKEMYCLVDLIATGDSQTKEGMLLQEPYLQFLELEKIIFSGHRKRNKYRNRKGKIILEKFTIKSFMGLLFYCHWKLTQEKKAFKKCKYCGRYFIPEKRRDTKYCSNPAPDMPKKTCAQWAPDFYKLQRRKKNPEERYYHNQYSYYSREMKKAREEGNYDSYKILEDLRKKLSEGFATKQITVQDSKENDNNE